MKSNNDNAIELTHITKEYVIHHEKPTLVEKFYKSASRKKEETFIALNDVSLTIKKGERIGIVGPNGSGKTTLLKIISGIASPTKGTVFTYGKTISIIDLEAGFHHDLTGEQNIFLNGMLLGMTKREIQNKLHKIIEYADIHQFIDTPLFTYSTGMKLRLGFSIAIHAHPENLILDEGLGVGDDNFREKAKRTLLNSKLHSTIIISAHDLELIEQQCTRIIILNRGSIIRDGGLETLKSYGRYIIK